ncbi:chaperone NapD [Campylobacter sp. MIT 21-1685]|uniref:chaperone NapD n=1 Tax=unclassified Campylobacter TaxID=2593542 RepID=UPI00224A9A3D|nr:MULTISPECIES: chaperone NapD [unclassified Campylobacter]MCX2682990.1 chaperone NapD [Campylobacter sp. MIT 21-1684]MCX2751272.1 chaperone NapD [Campylobacter sp. MIT 21-1682]MCX2807471.1 chaperone NapD [Campylobacter sp. MIT 21-1685]
MNVSSVLIVAKEQYVEELLLRINAIENCSVEASEKERIIVVIESDNLENELVAYKKLENLPNIISINMVFSYQDLDEDIQKAQNSIALCSVEKEQKAEDVSYYGNIFQKFS